jgi:ribosome-associated protein
MIRLGQLLKLAGVLEAGGEVKALLAEGSVTVNGAVEQRRGRQLAPGDRVRVGELELEVTGSGSEPSAQAGHPVAPPR